jgi:pentatricopeptide repeat protein
MCLLHTLYTHLKDTGRTTILCLIRRHICVNRIGQSLCVISALQTTATVKNPTLSSMWTFKISPSSVQVFQEMKAMSTRDPRCKPNVITYSALMTACCAGGQPEKAHEVFQEMQAAGIKPDQISYSTLIAGNCPRVPSSVQPSAGSESCVSLVC